MIEAKNRETRLKLKTGRLETEPDVVDTANAKLDINKANDHKKAEKLDPIIVQCELDYQQAVDAV